MPDESATKPSQQDVHDAFGILYEQLSQAYWVATRIEDKDRIRGIADAVFEILTELNRADIQTRTGEFVALTRAVDDAEKRLVKLKEDIDQIIHRVKVATDLTNAVDKALAQSAKFFVV